MLFFSDNYTFFACFVDAFDNFLYCEPLKSKRPKEILACVINLKKNNSALSKLACICSDEGLEFVVRLVPRINYYVFASYLTSFYLQANRAAFKKLGIDLYHIRGKHKAFLSENFVKVVKNRVYKQLRDNFDDSWASILPQVVLNINSSPQKALGSLTPAEVNDPVSDPLVREIREKRQIELFPPKKEAPQAFEVNDFVYVDTKESPFQKGFDTKRYTNKSYNMNSDVND